MDLKTVIFDSRNDIPTVITEEDFTVSFFNEAALNFISGLTAGRPLYDFIAIYDKNDLKRSKYPSSALIGYGGKKYFCAFCPVISGFIKQYVFSIAVPNNAGYDDCEQYLTMKLAVLSKYIGGKYESAPVGLEKAFNKYYSSYEANMRLLAAMSGDDKPSAVKIKNMLDDVLSFYNGLRYGAASGKRCDVITNEEIILMKRYVSVILVCAYDICMSVSRNGFCSVSVNCSKEDGITEFSFSVLPKHKFSVLLNKAEDTEDAVYFLLGREAESMLMIKTLARQIRGQADIEYDDLSDRLNFCLTVPYENAENVKSGSAHFADLAYIAVRACLSVRGKA